MRQLLFISLLLFSSTCWAEFAGYLLVPVGQLAAWTSRLDVIIAGQPGTTHYAAVVEPVVATYPYRLLQIDERAQSVLTEEEWNSRLATMPVEFVRPLPD